MSGELKHAEIQYSGQIQSLHSSDEFKCSSSQSGLNALLLNTTLKTLE